MQKKHFFMGLSLLLITIPFFGQQTFRFKYQKGDQYRIISTINEKVYFNGEFYHDTIITNKISVKMTNVSGGRASIAGTFYLTENASYGTNIFNAVNLNYQTFFKQNQYGFCYDDGQAFMPSVRNVPLFPEQAINIGESWSNNGYEVHDFRREPYNIPTPYKFPITVNYTYLGQTQKETLLDIIQIEYKVLHNDAYSASVRSIHSIRPRRIIGESKQILLWDNNLGRPHSHTDEFKLTLQNNDGNEIEYIATGRAIVLNSPEMDYDKMEREILRNLDHSDLKDIKLEKKPLGLSLSFSDLQFYPDTAIMLPGEEQKLEKIVRILKNYPERDILVAGHTALAGNEADQNKLSLDRALAIANYFFQANVRSSDRIFVEGKGSTEPIAPNTTEEGMKKNRRVEVIILEN